MTVWRLVADVGGTRVRFARSIGPGAISDATTTAVQSFASFTDALQAYLADIGNTRGMREIAVAAAGPRDGDVIALTNAPWVISQTDIANRFGVPAYLLNDLEAVAYVLPHLNGDDKLEIGNTPAPLNGAKIAINVGTGFGAALAIPIGNAWQAQACEPGHMTINPSRSLFDDARHRRQTIEEVLSGLALSTGAKAEEVDRTPDRAVVATFGDVCGNLVLACGAFGGAYLCGSVAQAWMVPEHHGLFRGAFEDKGRMRDRMRQVKTCLLLSPVPGLIGLTHVGRHTG